MGLSIDGRSRRKGEESGHMPSGKDLRVGMSYGSCEPLSMTGAKLRKRCPNGCSQAETELWPKEIMQLRDVFREGSR